MLLVLAAAHETGLLAAFQTALPLPTTPWLRRLLPLTRLKLLLTLLFLCAVGLRRTWELRGYTGTALACVTGRLVAYGYRTTERFLAQLARADADGPLMDALTRWSNRLWSTGRTTPPIPPSHQLTAPPLDPLEPPAITRTVMYVDSHRKPVFCDKRIPRGLIGRTGKVLGARTLICLHDAQGHVLLVQTARGDAHLIQETPRILERYAQVTGQPLHAAVVIDREGMGAAFLFGMLLAGHTVITCLRSNQYDGLDSFTDVGAFESLRVTANGQVLQEVASARYHLTVPEGTVGPLTLQVALIRDWSRMQASDPDPTVPWDADLDGDAGMWWRDDWDAPAATPRATAPRLIPIVSTDLTLTKEEIVTWYRGRWPHQENVFKDWLIPLHLDTNHGYQKAPTVHTEEAKRRAELHAQEQTLTQRIASARTRLHHAITRQHKAQHAQQAHAAKVLEGRRVEDDARQMRMEQRQKRAEAAITEAPQMLEGYCQKMRVVRRELEELDAQSRPMYE